MAHIFISYARADEPAAVLVADRLREAGFEVWRDDELPAHRSYSEVIEERIQGAAAVVVLWSAEAAKSQWVRAEADAARASSTLVQATLDGAMPPMPFNQIQCAERRAGRSWWGASLHWRVRSKAMARRASPHATSPSACCRSRT